MVNGSSVRAKISWAIISCDSTVSVQCADWEVVGWYIATRPWILMNHVTDIFHQKVIHCDNVQQWKEIQHLTISTISFDTTFTNISFVAKKDFFFHIYNWSLRTTDWIYSVKWRVWKRSSFEFREFEYVDLDGQLNAKYVGNINQLIGGNVQYAINELLQDVIPYAAGVMN